ncbi:MAG: TldD/PmbA family protein, partial [Asgard group archaeon]|nr:TldD/PmbA family protein [Asgard group archaeon]
ERSLEQKICSEADLVLLRGQTRKVTICIMKNGEITDFSNVILNGISSRVLVDNKSWGFSSTNQQDKENAKSILNDSIKLAKAASASKTQIINLQPIKSLEIDIATPMKKNIDNISAEEIVNVVKEANKGLKDAGYRIKSSEITYISITDNKHFLSSENVKIKQHYSRVMLFVDAIARENGTVCPASENYGHAGGFELFTEKSPYDLGKKVGIKAVDLLKAKSPPSGKFKVIIHPTLCATLLHEALGHPLEADLAMAGGGFSDRIGELVSSNLATIYDDGMVPNGLGYFTYDDEGIECKRTVMIENGILKSYLHDRTSAAIAGVSPTGNSHAWDYSVEPLIRQTNIGLAPGDFNEEEMLEDIKSGYYLTGTFGGQANISGDFTFGFQNSFKITNGEIGEELRGANVSGNAIDVFKSIDAINKEDVLRPGACGKFQFAIQGRVAPAIRCEILIGGTGGE